MLNEKTFLNHKEKANWSSVNATRVIAGGLGILIGISGLDHGICETLQGNTPTNGLLINAIAAGSKWTVWNEGTEGAFTIIPNFLLTGILAIIMGILIATWSIGFIHKKNGVPVFLFLALLLFLFGGGIAQVFCVLLLWYVASRIDRPWPGWRKILPQESRKRIANVWRWSLISALALFMIPLEIAVFGFVPGVTNHNQLNYICWSFLGLVFLLLLVTFISGFVHDIERQDNVLVE